MTRFSQGGQGGRDTRKAKERQAASGSSRADDDSTSERPTRCRPHFTRTEPPTSNGRSANSEVFLFLSICKTPSTSETILAVHGKRFRAAFRVESVRTWAPAAQPRPRRPPTSAGAAPPGGRASGAATSQHATRRQRAAPEVTSPEAQAARAGEMAAAAVKLVPAAVVPPVGRVCHLEIPVGISSFKIPFFTDFCL